MSDLFNEADAPVAGHAPLADRLRPRRLEEFVGQEHLLAEGRPLSRLMAGSRPASLIFWGPPGTGKTTLARILARRWEAKFVEFSAVLSGVADIRRVVEEAKARLRRGGLTVLFIDEIHRFNKAQQDALLPHSEAGTVILLGATTENPSFEIIPALLSRSRVYVLHPLSEEDLGRICDLALADGERGLAGYGLVLTPEAREHFIACAFGDARRLLGFLEMALQMTPLGESSTRTVDLALAEEAVGRRALRYDKAGEEHYNLISALHKSLRGSDPDASLYWLARMIEAGEDPHYLLRRMMRFASEDVGLADPYALNQVAAALKAFDLMGPPEGYLALAQAAVYLALAPKSNAIYTAYGQAEKDARELGPLEVPLAGRNAPTRLMKELGYSEGYLYPHDFPGAVTDQRYLPDKLKNRRYYQPTDRGREKAIRERIRQIAQARAAFRKRRENE